MTTVAPTPVTATTGHVGLNVSDVDRSIAFYRSVFGLDVLGEGRAPERRWAFLGRDGRLVVTLWQQSAGRFDTGRPGLHHLSFEVASMGEVEAAVALLRSLDVPLIYDEIVPHVEGAPSGGIFFTDLDGIRLEVFASSGAQRAPALAHGEPSCGFF